MRVLVTGVAGFVGRHLVRAWKEQYPQCEIWGIARGEAGNNIAAVHRVISADLRDAQPLKQLCQWHTFDWIVHLAAQSFVPESFTHPQETWATNLWGTFHLLEALRENNFRGRFLFVGSCAQYGTVRAENLPIKEHAPFFPNNPYGASKAAAEMLCYQYSQSYGADVIIARAFNAIGPGQSPRFVISDCARQIARIELALQEPVLTIGNLDVTRDFLDVHDVIDAYRHLLEKGKKGEAYNVCSGRETRLADAIDLLTSFSSQHIKIETNRARERPLDTSRLQGDHEKLTRHTGWRPTRELHDTLQEVFLYWKEELRR